MLMLLYVQNRMVTVAKACPLDYHKTWDQLKRKYHKKVLCGLSVMYDIETEVSDYRYSPSREKGTSRLAWAACWSSPNLWAVAAALRYSA